MSRIGKYVKRISAMRYHLWNTPCKVARIQILQKNKIGVKIAVKKSNVSLSENDMLPKTYGCISVFWSILNCLAIWFCDFFLAILWMFMVSFGCSAHPLKPFDGRAAQSYTPLHLCIFDYIWDLNSLACINILSLFFTLFRHFLQDYSCS